MDRKTQFLYRLLFGIVMIGASIFLSFRFLMKGPPLIKVLALALIIGVSYLVVDYIKRKTNENE